MPTFFLEKAAADFDIGVDEPNPRRQELLERPSLLLDDNRALVEKFAEMFPHTEEGGRVQEHIDGPLPVSLGLKEANVCSARLQITSVRKNYTDIWASYPQNPDLLPQYYINYLLTFTPQRRGEPPRSRTLFLATLNTREQIAVMRLPDLQMSEEEVQRLANKHLRQSEQLQRTRTELALFIARRQHQ